MSSFRVTRVSSSLRAAKQQKLILSPRTDIDMEKQIQSVKSPKSTQNLNNSSTCDESICESNGEHEASKLSRNDHRAMLIQLVHEARRYQKEQLAKLGIDIDSAACDIVCPKAAVILNSDNVDNLMQDIDLLLLEHADYQYEKVLREIQALLLFRSSHFLPPEFKTHFVHRK